MMLDLKSLDGSLWLCDPRHLRAAVARVFAVRPCPTAREVAVARREELERADRIAESAVPGVGGTQAAAPAGGIRAVKGRVGVIPVHGPIEQRMSTELMKAGGTSCDFISRALDVLLADTGIGAVVFHVDSGGGSTYGVEELATKIYDARGQKPLYAAIDSVGCSAACEIATSAETVVITPGGDTASIGVYCIHVDQSKALEEEGLSVTLVKAGKFKAETAPFAPLTDEAKGYLQERVDECYQSFVSAMARNRGVGAAHVRERFGQGRPMGAAAALDAKLVDRVMPFEALMSKLTGGAGAPGQSSRAADVAVLRMRQQQRKRAAGA